MGFLDIFKKQSTESISKNAGVNIGGSADKRTQPSSPPVLAPASIFTGQSLESANLRKRNRYLLADHLYMTDERLYSAIQLMAIMIQKSIGGCGIRVEAGEKLTNQEENAVEEAEIWARKVELKDLFYNYTLDLWKYGDAVDVIKFNGSKGISGFKPLPMHAITAVDKKSNIGRTDNTDLIDSANWYVLNEQVTGNQEDFQSIRNDRILQISFNNRRSLIKDNLGRWTHNIWSMSPITSLIGIIEWKQVLMRNDMLWRNRNVPREWHKLDLSEYDPSKYAGTHQEKIAAAKAGAQSAIEDYAINNKRREADQGFVTGMGVDIGYIEPGTMNYADPMPIIDQINSLIGGPTGTPGAVLGGTTSGFSSLDKSASFLALRAEIYAGSIQRQLEKVMRRHIGITHPNIGDDVIDRVFIKNRLILDKDRAELAKIVAILVGAKVFTPDEIRQIWGLDPMTEKQANSLLQWIKDTNPKGSSPEEVLSTENDRNTDSPTGDQESPAQRDRNSLTRGDRLGEK